MPLGRGQTFAGYTIVRLLGSGGMGEVYLAQHPTLPRRDALKLLPVDWSTDAEYRARFNREADLASTLWHPNIVGVHDRGEEDGQPGPPRNRPRHRVASYLPPTVLSHSRVRSRLPSGMLLPTARQHQSRK
jgi:serine/threonine protein kinase